MVHYVNGLMPGNNPHLHDMEQPLSTVPSAIEGEVSVIKLPSYPRLILAGYSYGSMVASHLPSAERVLKLFESAAEGSAESEIQLRASHLSSQTWKDHETRQERKCGRMNLRAPPSHSDIGSSHSSSSVLVGGFESEAAEQRIDRESRRSLDVRKSLDRVHEKICFRSHRFPNGRKESDDDTNPAGPKCNMIVPQICYLLISPVLPPVAAFATFFSDLSFKGRGTEKGISSHDASHELTRYPSLAVYGSKDFFTSVKKLRTWGQELSRTAGSDFLSHEVDGAGHFWHETGALEQMKQRIGEWEGSL